MNKLPTLQKPKINLEPATRLIKKIIDNKKNVFHLSHTDLDGFSCQLIVSILIDSSSSTIAYANADYGNILPKLKDLIANIEEGDLLLITDLNLDADSAEWINKESENQGFQILLLDHHMTGRLQAKKYDWYFLDESISGTAITYHTCKSLLDNNDLLEYIVLHVDSYDMWRKENGFIFTRTAFFADVVKNYQIDSKYNTIYMINVINRLFNILYEQSIYELDAVESELLNTISTTLLYLSKKYHSDELYQFLKNPNLSTAVRMATFPSGELLPANTCKTFDDKGTVYLYEDISSKTAQYSFDYFLTEDIDTNSNNVYIKYDNKYGTVMVRSSNETAVKYAELLGGGGHGNAAGAKLDTSKFPDTTSIADLINKQ